MAKTTLRGLQITDSTVQRDDLDALTTGQAVVKKIVQGSGISLSSTGADAGTGDVTISGTINIGKSIYVDSVNGNDSTGARGRLDQPFLTVAAATSASGITSGDIILLTPGTFVENSGIVLPNGVSLFGRGSEATIITSTLNGNTSGAILVPGNNSIIQDLTITANAASGVFQYPIGTRGNKGQPDFTGAIFKSLVINGDSDGIYINGTTSCDFTAYDCIINTKYDALATIGTSSIVLGNFYNCFINVVGPATTGSGTTSRGLVATTFGTINFIGGRISVNGASGTNEGVTVANSGGGSPTAMNLFNVGIFVGTSATTVYDLYADSSTGIINISGVVRTDGGELVTSGPIVDLSRNLSKDTILPTTVMPALTGDITTSAGSISTTLSTVNTNVGSFGSSSTVPSFTVNAKGLITAVSNVTISVGIPQNSQSTNYTTVLADGNGQILHPSSDNNARTFTIAANSSVAYPVGTAITFVNLINTITIAINSDTLLLAGSGATGSRTLAVAGIATALKVTSTEWIISGTGLT